MSRSCDVDCLSFHNNKHGILDSIILKYDETKMDKTDEFVQETNVYSNPLASQGGWSGPSLFLYCLGGISLPSSGMLG